MKSLSTAAMNIDGQPMFKLLDKAKRLEAEGRSVLHFEIGDPDFNTPQNIVEAACNAIRAGDSHYASSMGLLEFRHRICDATERSRGFRPDVQQVLVTPGANIAIFYSVYCLANPGDEVIVPDPGFPTYYSTIKMCGCVPVRVPLYESNQFRMNPDDIERRVTDKTRLIIINSPQNPTGSVMTPEELRAVFDIAERHDLYIYSDEIYARMNYGDTPFSSPAQYDGCRERVILSNGFSKAFAMTGWRLGAVVAPEAVAERMGMLLQTTSSCVSPFIQRAGMEAAMGPQDAVMEMMAEYRARRDLLVSGLNAIDGITCLSPGGAFYVFPNINALGVESGALADHLLEDAGVATLPGDCFGEMGRGYLRLCYAASRAHISEALSRIAYSVAKLRSGAAPGHSLTL